VTDLRCTGEASVGNGTKVFPAETSYLMTVIPPGQAGTLFRLSGTASGIPCKLTMFPGAEIETVSVRNFLKQKLRAIEITRFIRLNSENCYFENY
jgi:hypothetical protein